MSNNFHTPIPVAPTKPPADSETFNGPLGELDEALTDHENRIGALEGEFSPKSNNPSEYLDGNGNWTVPVGTGDVNGHVIQEEGVALPQRANMNFEGAGVTVTNEAEGTRITIPGATGVLESVVAGTNVTVDNTDPVNPVINASGVLESVVAGTNVTVDNTDPANPIINATGGGGGAPVYNVTDYGAVSNYYFIDDGAMNAGSATLTSASGVFTVDHVGKKIAVQGAGSGGSILYTTISAYVNSTTLTLADANASGGNISGKKAEWGIDNTSAFQACIDDASSMHGTMYVPAGNYMVGPLNLTNTTGWTLTGEGINATRLYALPSDWSAATGHLLDLTGAHDMVIKMLQIGAFNMITQPATAMCLMQTSANLANAVALEDIYISGSYKKCTVYIYGVPSSTMVRCKLYNYIVGTNEVLVYSGTNSIYSLTSAFTTVASGFYSTSDWTHFDTELHKFGGNSTGAPFRFDQASDIRIYGGVISAGGAQYVLVSGSCSNIMFSGVTFETESEPTPANVISTSGTITGLAFDQCTYVITGDLLAGSGNILGTTGGVSGYHFSSIIGNNITGGVTMYLGLIGHDANELNSCFICERKGILVGLRVFSSASPGAGKSYTYTVRKDFGDTPITCSHSDSNVSSSDLAHYAHVVPGSYISVKFVSTAGASPTRALASLLFIPTG